MHLAFVFAGGTEMMHLKITTRTTTTAILAATLLVAAAATFMSTQQIAQAITVEEGIQLINQGADEVEPFSSDAAERLRAIAEGLPRPAIS
jgi:predicted branched-subunit amino acid permease